METQQSVLNSPPPVQRITLPDGTQVTRYVVFRDVETGKWVSRRDAAAMQPGLLITEHRQHVCKSSAAAEQSAA